MPDDGGYMPDDASFAHPDIPPCRCGGTRWYYYETVGQANHHDVQIVDGVLEVGELLDWEEIDYEARLECAACGHDIKCPLPTR
jgi:hypothetical protein